MSKIEVPEWMLERAALLDTGGAAPSSSTPAAPLHSYAEMPEGALMWVSPCFCLPGEVGADGGTLPHAFREHVRLIVFEK